jgi:hypothetical protein
VAWLENENTIPLLNYNQSNFECQAVDEIRDGYFEKGLTARKHPAWMPVVELSFFPLHFKLRKSNLKQDPKKSLSRSS